MSEDAAPEALPEAPAVSFELTGADGAALAEARLTHDPMGRLFRGVLTAAVSLLPATLGLVVNLRDRAPLAPLLLFALPALLFWFGLPAIARRAGRRTVEALRAGQRQLTFRVEAEGLVLADQVSEEMRIPWRLITSVDAIPAGRVITTRHPLHHLIPTRALTEDFARALDHHGARGRGTTT